MKHYSIIPAAILALALSTGCGDRFLTVENPTAEPIEEAEQVHDPGIGPEESILRREDSMKIHRGTRGGLRPARVD